MIGRWLLALAGAFLGASAMGQGFVSVYCSLDRQFSEEILLEFERRTGIEVRITMDTEDNKTIGMVNRIISEKDSPRCDVYWNNELGQTIRLQNMGLLQPYVSPNAADIPETFKDPNGYWTGFAARARVIIVNTEKLPDRASWPVGLNDLVDPKWRGRVSMAKPVTGTTMTHVAALFSVWGEERTKRWLDQLTENEIYWNKGNAQVMRDVGEGVVDWGFTDTDDANVSRLKGRPTDIVVPDQGDDGQGTLLIPNSVMIIAGARNLDNARKIVDYILSREVEEKLARGRSAQIPLHPGVSVPEGGLSIDEVKAMQVDWREVGRMIEEHGRYLHRKFEGGGEDSGTKTTTFIIVIGVVCAVIAFVILGRRSAAAR